MPGQTFSDITPITQSAPPASAQQKQTFTDVTPIGDNLPAIVSKTISGQSLSPGEQQSAQELRESNSHAEADAYAKAGQMSLGGGGLQNVAAEDSPSILRWLYNQPKIKNVVDAAIADAAHIPGSRTIKAAWESFGKPLTSAAGGGLKNVEGTEGAAENAAGEFEPGPTPKRGQLAADFKDPGAPLPAKPAPELQQAQALTNGGRPAAPNPSDALGSIPAPKLPQTSAAPAKELTRKSIAQYRAEIGPQLEEGLGAGPPLRPNVPLRGQLNAGIKGASEAALPEGHTAVDSSALRSYKYEPATREFEAWPTSGDTVYRYAEVSPESAKAFQDAPSKGKAFQQIKNEGTLVAKRINGKWVSVKPVERGTIASQMQ